MVNEYQVGREFIGRLNYGDDLYNGLTAFIQEKNIQAGTIELIGACQKAVVSIYDQAKKVYHNISFNEPAEILCCKGNISMNNGKPFIHAHIVLSGHDGNAVGGHLIEGTKIFAGEFYIRELKGPALDRKHDQTTGLTLWE